MAGTLQYIGTLTLKTETLELLYGTRGSTVRFRVSSPSVANLVTYLETNILPFGGSGKFVGADSGFDRMIEVELPGTVATIAGIIPEVFFDQWEMVTNEGSDTIFSDPLLVGGANPVLDYNDKTVLSRLARDGGTISDAVDSCNSDVTDGNLTAPPGGTFVTPSTGAATQVALEVLKGQTDYAQPTRVLRHTSYCSAQAFYNSTLAHEETIYSLGHLLTEISSGWTFNCPGRLISKISSILPLVAPPDEAPYYMWGWKKTFTREPVLANFIMEISTEYELNLWSNLRYATF